MVDIGTVEVIPPAEVEDVELYHLKSLVTKYVSCQDAKVIAIQYSITAISIGLVALVLSWLIRRQLAFPGCPCRKSNSNILMVQSAENWCRENAPDDIVTFIRFTCQ